MTQSRGIIWLDPVICRDLSAFQPLLAWHLALIPPPRVRFRMTVPVRQNKIYPASAPNFTSDQYPAEFIYSYSNPRYRVHTL